MHSCIHVSGMPAMFIRPDADALQNDIVEAGKIRCSLG
jgi:hypothetical protein